MGFKLTGKSGLRRSAGRRHTPRIQGLAAGRDGGIVRDHTRPAFLPNSPQEQAWDSNSPRLGGLES